MKNLMNDILSAAGAEVSIIPVMQGEGVMKIDESQLPDSLPILALRNAVLFPGTSCFSRAALNFMKSTCSRFLTGSGGRGS